MKLLFLIFYYCHSIALWFTKNLCCCCCYCLRYLLLQHFRFMCKVFSFFFFLNHTNEHNKLLIHLSTVLYLFVCSSSFISCSSFYHISTFISIFICALLNTFAKYSTCNIYFTASNILHCDCCAAFAAAAALHSTTTLLYCLLAVRVLLQIALQKRQTNFQFQYCVLLILGRWV